MNAAAREQLRDAGISPAGWARRHFGDAEWGGDECGCPDDRCIGYHHAEWGGDECGCPDDRCIGYHHDEGAECGCLAYLLSIDTGQSSNEGQA